MGLFFLIRVKNPLGVWTESQTREKLAAPYGRRRPADALI